MAYEFNRAAPLNFQQGQVVFVGQRGGIVVDHAAGTTRLVMLDGTTIGHGTAKADVASDWISNAPGTRGRIAVVPLLDNHYEFVLENLQQPPVVRSWQLW